MHVQHHPVTPEEWRRLADEPEFRALVRSRRRFVVPATLFFIAYYLALPVLVGFDPALMSRPVAGPLTLAYAFALSQFGMAWLLLLAYLLRARGYDKHVLRLRKRERAELHG